MLFIFDENLSPKLAEGLHLLEQGNSRPHVRISVTDIVTLAGVVGKSDEEVIKIAGENNGIIVTQDNDFRRIKHYYQLYKEHNVGVVIYKPVNQKVNYWQLVNTFINRWEDLRDLNSIKRPFAYQLTKNGLSKLSF